VSRRLHEAALAVTLDGTVLIGMTHVGRERDPEALLRLALEEDGDVFIGVAMTETEGALARMRLDNAGAEAVARVVGQRQRRRRETTRRTRPTRS
jgi:hypothetical protein